MPGGAAPWYAEWMMAAWGWAMDEEREMAGMMGMGDGHGRMAAAPGAMPQSALPGFPGASHLYHIGATGFFLDHPQHIALTTEQQAGLNKAKEQALLAKSTADRAVEQAEQELWTLTAADQPDAAKIEAKIAEIGKLRGDERLAFIRAVGDASKLLTDEQRKSPHRLRAARARRSRCGSDGPHERHVTMPHAERHRERVRAAFRQRDTRADG